MQVRYRVMVNEFAAAGLLTELGASEVELRTLGEGRALERECPLADFEKLLARGLVGSQDFVDVGNGWEPVSGCQRFAGMCPGTKVKATGWWIVGGMAVAATLVLLARFIWG